MKAETNNQSGVGASLLRREDDRHLRGRGEFVADIRLPGTQQVVFLRSPHAHARIRGIAVPPSAKGRVFTAEDLPRLGRLRAIPRWPGFKVAGWPPLATEKVRYVGGSSPPAWPRHTLKPRTWRRGTVEFEVLDAVVDAAPALGKRGAWCTSIGATTFSATAVAAATSRRRRAPPKWSSREFRMNRQSRCRWRAAPCWPSRPPARRGRDLRLDQDAAHGPAAIGEVLGIESTASG